MNYYAFIPLTAFILTFFTFTYVFAQKRKSPVNTAYLFYSFFSSLFLFEMFIIWAKIQEEFLIILLERLAAMTIFMVGFCFLNFTYTILERKKDYIYYGLFTAVMISSLLAISTNLYVYGYKVYEWGISVNGGILFVPIALISVCFPSLYSLSIVYKGMKNINNRNQKKQLSLFFYGSSIVIIVATISDVILPGIFNIKNVIRIGIPLLGIQSLLVFIAAKKYNFLSISVEEVANDLFENLQDGIILVNKVKNIIQINETAEKLFNLQHSDIQTLKISELFENYNFNENYKNYETSINSDQQQRIVSLSQATVNQYNVELGKILIIRDITENKKAEKELQDSKTKLENLAVDLAQANASLEQKVVERTHSLQVSNEQLQREILERTRAEAELAAEKERLAVTLGSIGDGVITTDTTGQIVLLNKVAEQLTGWSQAEAMGHPLATVFCVMDEKTRHPRRNPIETALHPDAVVSHIQYALLLAKDQTERLIAETTAPIRAQGGHVIGAVLVFRDITELRKLEEELMKADKLESIGVLAGGIAHDFNNILTAIIGNISLAKMYADPNDKVFARLVNAEKASAQAQNLTQQLLTFSKGGSLVRKPSSIVDIVKDSMEFSLRGASVKCELTVNDDIWPIEVDAGRISQVINNLIINANQAMPDGGIIEVRIENFEMYDGHLHAFLPLKPGKYIKIAVQDNGAGIPEEMLQKIFDPYFTTKKKGSGLGLFSCYSIIKKHDGHIAVESTPGVGTTFYVYIPASDKALVHKKDAPDVGSTGQGYILIMEDEETIRDVTGEMLSHFGYEVAVAKDGSEAIALYKHARESDRPFDVVIMDLTIPGGMGGKEAIKKILEVDPQAKVVVASGYSTDPIIADFTQYGFCERIAKPYKSEELHTLLHRIITGTSR